MGDVTYAKANVTQRKSDTRVEHRKVRFVLEGGTVRILERDGTLTAEAAVAEVQSSSRSQAVVVTAEGETWTASKLGCGCGN